ncbi:MAG: glycosyltransferase family 1 protein, partial [Chlamydiia bacterium]|nr:glycosyltransferase family 1 protein [Chlamydiia bacterium]
FLSILVDPVAYSLELTGAAYCAVSCVDRLDCAFLKQAGFSPVCFLSHAIERSLSHPPEAPRPYDIVFLGSCYDHEGLRRSWRDKHGKEKAALMEEAAERLYGESGTSIVQAVFSTWAENGESLTGLDVKQLCYDVDYYVRGRDRMELITSFPNREVHVFGDVQWTTQETARSWEGALRSFPNVVVHPAVSYAETFEVMKQAKVCLNSAPFFKDGTHERIFGGMACGCAVVTSHSHYIEEQFVHGEEVLLYEPDLKDLVIPDVEAVLDDDAYRIDLARKGQNKTHAHHSWDNRAESLLKELPPLLKLLPLR